MALVPGTRLGPYEVVAPLGAGGMGEVYRAHDSGLKRDVALKVLPDAFAGDSERLARFEREAHVLAALNHPHIAAIHGLAQQGTSRALVLELVEGPTLADRIAADPIPVDEALALAQQIAEALEAAHDQGIVHRDLKPANVKVTPDGTVKVLDFGLAKALEPAGGGRDPGAAAAPTITSPLLTQRGMVLGTAAYMSPEQARGREADRRSDIWAFGCVLYEMLTGVRAFPGDEVADALAAIVRGEPDWAALPADTPPAIRRLLQRCLKKSLKDRLPHIGVARQEIAEVLAAPAVSRTAAAPTPQLPSARASRVPWVVAVLAIAAAVASLAVSAPWRAPAELPRVAFEVVSPGGSLLTAISPDGKYLVARQTEAAVVRLWIRPLDRTTGTILPGTDDGNYPFWSPDSRQIGFFADGKLKVVGLSGEAPQILADAPRGRGGAWHPDGVILFAPTFSGPLHRVPAAGGLSAPVTALDASRGDQGHIFPRFLPGGDRFLFFVAGPSRDHRGIYVSSLSGMSPRRLVAADTRPEFALPDLLLYLQGSTLMAQRLDLRTTELRDVPMRIAESVVWNANVATSVTASDTGILAYRVGGSSDRHLAWVDRTGRVESSVGAPGLYENPRLSPDGQRLAFYLDGDIWIADLARATRTRVTHDSGDDNDPVWSPDGTRLAFVSDRDGGVFNIYARNADGSGDDTLLLKTAGQKRLNDWSRDGRYLLYHERQPTTGDDLWVLPLDGDRQPQRYLATPADEMWASFSPDGRWVAYTSLETGVPQVFVQRFPEATARVQVSDTLGVQPIWRHDGGELFFDGTTRLMSADVVASADRLTFGPPREVFRGWLQPIRPHNLDVAADGRRFMVVAAVQEAPSPIVVTLNWQSGLPR